MIVCHEKNIRIIFLVLATTTITNNAPAASWVTSQKIEATVTNSELFNGHPTTDFVLVGGAGTGNADTVDGIDSSQFLRSDISDSFDGTTLTINGDLQILSGGDLTVTGSVNLAATDASGTRGVITIGGSSFAHAYGANNAFVGQGAGNFSTTGGLNTGNGYLALASNTSGNYNTAVGAAALRLNTTGNNNTASGRAALYNNDTAHNNTASGYQALYKNTTGNNNTALGYRAGYDLDTGSNNINLGYTVTGTSESNTIRIGNAGQTACYVTGIYGQTASEDIFVMIGSDGKLGTITSSKKFKDDIQDMGSASAELQKLRPVTFRYKPEYEATGRIQYGLIAEEVEETCPDLVVYDKEKKPYTVRYNQLVPMLVNEYQQQQKKLDQIEQKTALCGEKKNVVLGNTPADALSITFANTINPAIITLSFVSKTYAYTIKFIFDGKESIIFASNTTADNIPIIIAANLNQTTVTFKHQHPSISSSTTPGTVFYEINGEDIAKIS